MTNGVLASTPYPYVSKVTSHHEQANDISSFFLLLKKHASLGHCLFGGQLNKPLKAESRAGQTTKDVKHWVCFDFDGVEASSHEEVVKNYLPRELHNVSYIAQLSASMFKPDQQKWSGHIFMMLAKPAEEKAVKQWMESLNFSNPALLGQISLTDSEQALHWPLDRTVASNSKLIFIAPPKCYNFKPDVVDPIKLIKKAKKDFLLPAFQPIDQETVRQKINELRRARGLDEMGYKLTAFEGEWVLSEGAECHVHDIKTSGDHFIRFNLNGGDSYAYFIDLRKPELVRNFKGEPYLKTEEVAPDLWKSLRKVAPRAVAKQALEENVEVLAFYATNQSSAVKIGSYDEATRDLVLHNSGERAAKAWQSEYGLVNQGMLPHMDLVFDPQCDVQYVSGSTQINTFKATKYMLQTPTSTEVSTLADIPPLLDKVLRSMLGSPTDEVYIHFVNWIAYIFQNRKKTGTAWVLSGTEGTGKGTFVKYILAPIFGPALVKTVQFGLLNQEFNDFLENVLFIVFDEADANAVDNSSALMAKLRHWITDDPITIRKMRTDPYPAPSFCNALLLSNKQTPVITSNADRRFNFGERQDQRLFFTPNEMTQLQVGAHLERFSDVLRRWPVDETKATTEIVDTVARATVHEATSSINQLIADAITKGDLQFFIDRMPSENESIADFHNRFNPIHLFRGDLDKYLDAAAKGQKILLEDENLFVLFRTLIPDVRYFQDSKTWRKRHYKALGLDVDRQHRAPGGQRKRGVMVEWQVPEDTQAFDRGEEKPNKASNDDGKVVDMVAVNKKKSRR